MHRFFVKNNHIQNNIIEITDSDVNHIKNVLRYTIKDKIEIVNLETRDIFVCEINRILNDKIECVILYKETSSNESKIYLHVLQGIPKFEKMELIIEKCTELGASEFTPVIMKRCVVKLDKKNEYKKIIRWNKIAEVAAKQSKRDLIPKVNPCIMLKNIYENLKEYDIVLIAYENEENYTLKHALKLLMKQSKKEYKIAILIGPEGGIDKEEKEYLSSLDYMLVSLGKRILRTETAPISMVSNILYELEGDE